MGSTAVCVYVQYSSLVNLVQDMTFSPTFFFFRLAPEDFEMLRLISRKTASLVNFFLRFIRNMQSLMYELCISLFLTFCSISKRILNTYPFIHKDTHTHSLTHTYVRDKYAHLQHALPLIKPKPRTHPHPQTPTYVFFFKPQKSG